MADYIHLEGSDIAEYPVNTKNRIKNMLLSTIGLGALLFVVVASRKFHGKKEEVQKVTEVNVMWDLINEDQCNNGISPEKCGSMDQCIWCDSGAIPSKCYSKENAKKLPPGVFNCHELDLQVNTYEKVEEELLCDDTVNQAVGYFRLGNQDKHYFFWFFESRDKRSTDPVVLWMTGGPGCSSELALFAENGPCEVDSSGESTIRNEFSWNKNANLIYIDQPAGTGFSYGTHDTNEVQVGHDMDLFIREFLTKFPQFEKNEFYVFGESYAGHYVPATAYAIHKANKKADAKFQVNLQGIGIGNGLTDPEVQYKSYADMAFNSGTAPSRITEEQYRSMKEYTPKCIDLIHKCNKENTDEACIVAVNECNAALIAPYALSGYNQYDMRKKCEVPGLCYDFSHVSKYLHNEKVLDYLGVVPQKRNWESCEMTAHDALMADWMKNYQSWVAELLEAGVRVLVYAGDVDFIVNYLGCRAWPLALKWSGAKGYNLAEEKDWSVNGVNSGKLRSYKNLSFLQVFQAGHMVPMDKPEEALIMLNTFINNKL